MSADGILTRILSARCLGKYSDKRRMKGLEVGENYIMNSIIYTL